LPIKKEEITKLIDELIKVRKKGGLTRQQKKDVDINIEICEMQLKIIKKDNEEERKK
jgi:hypothetical protein